MKLLNLLILITAFLVNSFLTTQVKNPILSKLSPWADTDYSEYFENENDFQLTENDYDDDDEKNDKIDYQHLFKDYSDTKSLLKKIEKLYLKRKENDATDPGSQLIRKIINKELYNNKKESF